MLMPAALLAMGASAWAGGETQVNYDGARSSGRVDGSGATARDHAMGNAVAAAGDGPSAFLANPASLVGQPLALSFDQSSSLFATRSLMAGSLPAGKWGTYGLSLGYTDLGLVEAIDVSGSSFSLKPYQVAMDLGWAQPAAFGFAVGGTLRGLYQSFGTYGSKTAYGLGLGATWKRAGLRAALAEDLDSDLDQISFIATTRLGLAYEQKWLATQRSLVSLQMDLGGDVGRTVRAGLEHWAYDALALRAGYEMPQQTEALGQWSAGLGFRYHAWSLDLSYGSRDILGSSQRATLTWVPGSK